MHTHTARPWLLIPCHSPFAWSSEFPAINSVLLLTNSAPSDSALSSAPLIHLSLFPCLRRGVCRFRWSLTAAGTRGSDASRHTNSISGLGYS